MLRWVPLLVVLMGCILLDCTVLGGSALAQTPAPAVSEEREAELNAQFQTAVDHYKAKRYTEALPLFREVADELESPNALLYVARCLREMGRTVEAYDAMAKTQRLAVERAHSEPRFQPTAVAAAEELADLRKRVGRITVSVPSAPAGTTLEVAGKGALLDTEVATEPGTVRVEVRAAGFAPVRREVAVPAGSHEHVIVHIVGQQPPPRPPSPPPTAPPMVSKGGGVRIAGYAVLGVGVVGWVALIVGGVVSDEKFSQLEERCGPGPCLTDEQDLIDEGRAYELAANIGIGVGAAGTIAGTLMIIFGGPTEEPASTPMVNASVLPGGGFLGVSGRF